MIILIFRNIHQVDSGRFKIHKTWNNAKSNLLFSSNNNSSYHFPIDIISQRGVNSLHRKSSITLGTKQIVTRVLLLLCFSVFTNAEWYIFTVLCSSNGDFTDGEVVHRNLPHAVCHAWCCHQIAQRARVWNLHEATVQQGTLRHHSSLWMGECSLRFWYRRR